MPNTVPVGVAFSDPALTAGTTITGATTATITTGTITTLSTTTATLGTATGSVGFYGKTPLVIRPYSAAVHATTGVATSASFGATQLAALNEVQLTLIGLGVWATV